MSNRITRRGFLAAGAAVAAAAPLSARARPQDAAGKPWRKAVKYGMVGAGSSVLEKFQLVQELGFDGIELDSPNGLDRQEVLDARDQTGLPIHGVVDSVHWSKPFSHPDPKVRAEGVRALETALQDCKAYGGDTVLVVPAVVNQGISYRDAWVRSRAEIMRMVPLAEELGLNIAFENVWNNFLLSPLEMAQYIDGFGSPHVGAYLDVGNLVRYAWPQHWVEALGRRIMKIDVKGYSRKKQNEEGLWKGFQVGIGDDDCDWPEVTKALREIGYAGWFTAEVGGGGRERLAEIASRMDRVMGA
ncbi:MAG: xylose isomerase [Planctomycetes bacterium]|nr:xylose isomerase [Planctomycetota bacterium]